MKNKGLIITLIVLLSIIIFFLVMFLVTYLNGGINFKNGIFNVGSKSTNVIYDKEFELSSIQNINVKQDAGDVIVKESWDGKIHAVVYGENTNDVIVELRNDGLYIDYTHQKKIAFFNFKNVKNDIIVYMPFLHCCEIRIENNYGNCKIGGFSGTDVNIDCDYGNVEIDSIHHAIVKCDYGNVQIGEVLRKCDIKTDCGNVEINNLLIEEDSSIEADLGNIEIRGTNDIYIDSSVDLGKTNINKNNRNSSVTLKVKCDLRQCRNK